MWIALYCLAGYLATGIVLRIITYAGPEDDGGLWAILLWPLVVIGIVVSR